MMKIRSYLYSLIAVVSFSINLNSLSVEAAAARAFEEAVVMGGRALSRTVSPAFVLGRRTFQPIHSMMMNLDLQKQPMIHLLNIC